MNSNYNMFGKKRSIYSSSDNTQNKKNLNIYNNRDNSRFTTVKNNGVTRSINYAERYNMYKGFAHCKKLEAEKSATNTNENCFNIYLDSNVDSMKKVNLEDWHYATVDYDFLNDKTILVNSHFPEIKNNNINSKTIPELYTYFNNSNSFNKVKYIRNFKYGHSMSNLTTN